MLIRRRRQYANNSSSRLAYSTSSAQARRSGLMLIRALHYSPRVSVNDICATTFQARLDGGCLCGYIRRASAFLAPLLTLAGTTKRLHITSSTLARAATMGDDDMGAYSRTAQRRSPDAAEARAPDITFLFAFHTTFLKYFQPAFFPHAPPHAADARLQIFRAFAYISIPAISAASAAAVRLHRRAMSGSQCQPIWH